MTKLADGEWHRLHPATPLLKGGIAFIAILGVIIANLRERIVEFFFPAFVCPDEFCDWEQDPMSRLLEQNLILVLLGVAVVLVLIIAGFWLSWRMHTFRVTDEVVEVRSGILFRTHRKARLDRVQGVNINRPFLARLVGAAKLEITGAGAEANMELAYLSSANADGLRSEVLRRASGIREQAAVARAVADGELPPEVLAPAAVEGENHAGLSDFARQRLAELTAPELDPNLAPPESVVKMDAGRLVGSTALSSSMIFLVVAIVVAVVLGFTTDISFGVVFAIVPMVLGIGTYLVSRVLKSLRYTIAATPDGVRVGYGLLSTANETLPPGRIHGVQVTQELLWRPFDWWTVQVNLASQMSVSQAANGAQQNTTVLPVGSREDVIRVLELVLPEVVDGDSRERVLAAFGRPTPEDDFTTSPRRAAVFRWFSWRRNGFRVTPEAVLLRKGAIWRTLSIVPTARIQSVAAHQGPIARAMGLAEGRIHTVQGPLVAAVGALDVRDVERLFRDASSEAVGAISRDRTHRWRAV
ncbi:PH domain-containing protein [Salinibacterium sp. ZJ77]|uniref:PH domain-containing protein n=1 Tax=Salinibacterium sp. ZJ77 TaxID=2708337 RepID=UPI00142424DE|nr:PH domain-containing protein [Salinibacterium sp. ZJ77]